MPDRQIRGQGNVSSGKGHFEITAYTGGLLHIHYFQGKSAPALPHWGLTVPQTAIPPVEEIKSGDSTEVKYEPYTLTFTTESESFVLSDAGGRERLRLLSCALEKAEVNDKATHHLHASFQTHTDECHYGLGQHQQGWMDHRGIEVPLWHDYEAEGGEVIGIPFMLSNQGYAILFDNPSRMRYTGGVDGQNRWWAEVADSISFFVLLGDTTDEIMKQLRTIIGATPIPPKKALGYIQCKQRYKSQEEILQVAREYRNRKYPCDMLIVDWFHWKVLGDMSLEPGSWPDPTAMNRELSALGYDVMISCWPRFEKDSQYYELLDENGWFMKNQDGETQYGTERDQRGALIDTSNPEAARWYWETIRNNYASHGFSSWWLDENEPDISPHRFQLFAGDGAAVHNLYPLTHTKAVYDGHRRDREDRCLILSRSAYFGAQQNGTTFWSSDIYPTWDVLRRQIPTGLNFCASGFTWWSSDIGGWQIWDMVPVTTKVMKIWITGSSMSAGFNLVLSARLSARTEPALKMKSGHTEKRRSGFWSATSSCATASCLTFTHWPTRLTNPESRLCVLCLWIFQMMKTLAISKINTCLVRLFWWRRCLQQLPPVGRFTSPGGRIGRTSGPGKFIPVAGTSGWKHRWIFCRSLSAPDPFFPGRKKCRILVQSRTWPLSVSAWERMQAWDRSLGER